MAFKFPWSKKKEEAPQTAAPAPAPAPEAAPVPAPAPAPAVNPALSDSIRDALEVAANDFINTPADAAHQEEKMALGMRLQDLKRTVDDAPCTFPGYDEIIVSAVQQLDAIARNSTPAQLEEHFAKLSAAIAARSNTEQNTPKFTPTMETHYYSVMLIDLQGRLNALLEGKRRKEDFIQRTRTMPPNERIGYRETIQAFTMELEDTELALMNLYKQIALCQGGLEEAQTSLLYSGPMTALDPTAVLSGIYKRSKSFRAEYEAMERNANKYQIMHQAEVEEQLIAVHRFAAAREETNRIAEETELYAGSVREQMNILTGRSQEQEAAPQQKAAPQQEAAPAQEAAPVAPEASEAPAMPDVFHDNFSAIPM